MPASNEKLQPTAQTAERNSDGGLDADVIVVGAGSAGIVVASRLANAGQSVLLVEAGDWADDERVANPQNWVALGGSDIDWNFETEPTPDVGSRTFPWPRGRAVGGSSAINAMIWLRGDARDFDNWAASGAKGWSYEDLLPSFKKTEEWGGEPRPVHGSEGEISVRHDPAPSKAARAFVDAAVAAGYEFNPDFNTGDVTGTGFIPHNIRDGVRDSTATAFFPNRRLPENLSLLTNVRARRILFEGTTATGLEIIDATDQLKTIRASQIVLSAGAIGSAHLLLLSGIGPREELERLGIEVIADLPVGQNLQDHVCVVMIAATSEDLEVDPRSALGEAALFASSSLNEAGAAPDLQVIIAPMGPEGPGTGFLFTPTITRPRSRGRITLSSADPGVRPVIEAGYLSAREDRERLRDGVRLVFNLLEVDPLRSLASALLSPPAPLQDDAAIDAFIDQTLGSYHHVSGTAKLGDDTTSVVDLGLRVRGIEGLRVIDASVLPSIPTVNINATVIAVAERGAELIISEAAKRS
jgi:choline dehydrogenase